MEKRFTRSEWFSLASFLLALISFVTYSVTGITAWLLVSIVLAVAFIALLILVLKYLRLPAWTVIGRDFLVQIDDKDANRATWRMKHEIRANHAGNKHYEFRNISSDGSLTGFSESPETRIINTIVEAGDYNVTIKFDHQILRGTTVSPWLDISCDKAYPEDREFLIALVDEHSKYLRLKVQFPEDRLPHPGTVKMHLLSSGTELELFPAPTCEGSEIAWSINKKWGRLIPGEYRISWHW